MTASSFPVVQTSDSLLSSPRSQAAGFCELAADLLRHGQARMAMDYCRLAIQAEPSAQAYKLLGDGLQQLQQYSEAERAYGQALQLAPGWAELYANMGTLCAAGQQWLKALRCYEKAIALKPELTQVQANLEQLWQQVGKTTADLSPLYEAVTTEPELGNVQNYLNLGRLFLRQQQLGRAAICYRQALGLDGSLSEARQRLEQIAKGAAVALPVARAADERPEGARPAQLSAAAMPAAHLAQPQTQAARVAYGQANAFVQQQQWAQAEVAYRETVRLEPELAVAQWRLAQVLERLEQREAAVEVYFGALSLQPELAQPMELCKFGELFVGQERPERAVSCYEWALRQDERLVEAQRRLGELLSAQERHEAAVDCYRKAVVIEPQAEVYHALGDGLTKLRRWSEAVEAYERAIELNSEFSWSHNNLGDALMQLERWQEAAKAYEQAIELNPEFHWSHYNLGISLSHLTDWTGAVTAYQRAKQLEPDFPDTSRKLNHALYQRAKADMATVVAYHCEAIEEEPLDLKQFQEALAIQPDNPQLYLNLANALAERNQISEATQLYQKAIQLKPDLVETSGRLKQFLDRDRDEAKPDSLTKLFDELTTTESTRFKAPTTFPNAESGDLSQAFQQIAQSLRPSADTHQTIFPSLADFVANASNAANFNEISTLKFCIFTPDFVGFVNNGGIGTSFYHTAQIFAKYGAQVTVIYCNRIAQLSQNQRDTITQRFAAEGITIVDLLSDYEEDTFSKFFPQDIFTVSAYLAYRYLKERQHSFDIVLFPEWRGIAYYCTLAKRQGLAFHDTAICVQTHSTMLWHALNNQADSFSREDVYIYQMERGAVRNADVVISPTQYLLNWKQQHGFQFPAHTYVQPYLLNYKDVEQQVIKIQNIDEIVFFGRLEKRKGIHHFINAIKKVVKLSGVNPGLKVTFLGKFSVVEQSPVLEYIKENLGGCPIELKILPVLNHEEAISYLRNTRSVAFIGSVADNSPLTVLECLHYRVPFIASRVGGIPELIEEKYHSDILFDLHPAEIAEKISSILQHGHCVVPPKAIQEGDNIQSWIMALLSIKKLACRTDQDVVHELQALAAGDAPGISICITHYNRATLLNKTFEGLQKQTFKNFEVIIVDDGSSDEAALQFLQEIADGEVLPNCTVLYQKNRYVGAARNKALSVARAPYIVFMDDDNYARPHQLETFLKAILTSKADALTCCSIAFDEDQDPAQPQDFQHIYLPLGQGLSAGLLQNTYGDANAIFRRTALDEVNGFTEDYGISWEDYELFAKLDAEGYQVGVVPEPLMWLRSTKGSVSRRGSMVPNYYRVLRPMLKHFPWNSFGDALLLTANQVIQGIYHGERRQVGTSIEPRNLLLRSADTGYVAVRQAVAYLLQQDDVSGAAAMLLDVATYSQSSRFLLWDWACLQIKQRKVPEAVKTLNVRFQQDWIEVEVAQALLRWELTGDVTPLISKLERAVAAVSNDGLLTYKLELGRLYACCGLNLPQAILLLGTLLDESEATYLNISPDIARGVELGHLSSGINHYICHGRNEGRPFNYYASELNPFINRVSQVQIIANYRDRFSSAVQQHLPNCLIQLCELLKDCLRSNAVLETFDVCRTLLQIVETNYMSSNVDLQHLKSESQPYFGVQHFIEFGQYEKRPCLLSDIPSKAFMTTLRQ